MTMNASANTPDLPPPLSDPPQGAVAPEPSSPTPEKPAGAGLRAKVLKGSLWTTGTYVVGQGMTFASNIMLAWWLLTDDFGLMALVGTIVAGLQMFSDVGIGPALIQNKREDAAFYNTAWTIQVFRGVALWLVACALAYPLSLVKEDLAPILYLLPVAAFTSVLNGMRSTAWATANCRLDIRLLAMLRMSTTAARILVMVGFAYFISRSAWALVVGSLVGSLMTCVFSHRMIPEIKNRFHFEKEAFRELINFGKWIFLSTIITFGAGQIDKFLLAGILSTSALGLYWNGVRIADIGPTFYKQIADWVGFPALSDLWRRDQERFKSRLLQMRMALTIPINLLLLLMTAVSPLATFYMYRHSRDTTFVQAGWVVQVLAFNSIAGMTTTSYGNAFMAMGRTKLNMYSVLAQLIAMVSATVGGYFFGVHWGYKIGIDGETGFILGVGVSQWVKYVVDAGMAKSCGVWQWKFDACMLIGGGVASLGCILLSDWLVWRFAF